jgi:hypothetical protein
MVSLKDISSIIKKMDMVNIYGLLVLGREKCMRVTGKITLGVVLAYSCGLIVKIMRVGGIMTNVMVKEYKFGLMATNM